MAEECLFQLPGRGPSFPSSLRADRCVSTGVSWREGNGTMESANVPVIEQQPALCYQVAGGRSDGHIIARSAAMREILDLCAEGRRYRCTRADPGRDRRREDGDRPRDPSPEPACCRALRARRLRVAARVGTGEEVVRRVARILFERTRADERASSAVQSRRHVVPGRRSATPAMGPSEVTGRFAGDSGRSREDGALSPAQPRVIASSTCDLETAVVENRFYSRLYYYLNAVRIDVPPLRHRQEDILALAEHFLAAAVSMLCPPRHQLPWRFSEEAGSVCCDTIGPAMSCNWPR